eukprot:TRINITY_DN4185_c0_g1_i1.p1 TRINITY_DN4185_c0_g1~~TRINITY_DN4185_c0_g1_i1.p1  ORF type:complete len:805 (+),score=171.40 TRINITY_DN4185_c0_g1_i1:361-2415(+)
MGVETDSRTEANDKHAIWFLIDSLFNIVFIVELGLRMYAEQRAWVKDAWNLFDATLVAIGVMDSWVLSFVSEANLRIVTLLRLFRLLKLLRIMRLLRLVKFLTELRLLILGTVQALKTTIWGFLLLVAIIYVSALFVTQVVGKNCCSEQDMFSAAIIPEYFGSLVRTAFTLFMFTMEFQPDIVRDTWVDGAFITFFMVVYTVFTNLMLLNMVSSVIVECILALSNEEAAREQADKEDSKKMEYVKELLQIFADIDTDDSGMLTWEEFAGLPAKPQGGNGTPADYSGQKARMKPGLRRALRIAGVTPNQAAELFHILDADTTGTISKEEFIRGFMRVKAPPESKHILRVECRVDTVVKKMDQVQHTLSGIARSLAVLTQDAGTGAVGVGSEQWGAPFASTPPGSSKQPTPAADTGGPLTSSGLVKLDVPLLLESDFDAVVGNEDGGAVGYLYPKAAASKAVGLYEARAPVAATAGAAAAAAASAEIDASWLKTPSSSAWLPAAAAAAGSAAGSAAGGAGGNGNAGAPAALSPVLAPAQRSPLASPALAPLSGAKAKAETPFRLQQDNVWARPITPRAGETDASTAGAGSVAAGGGGTTSVASAAAKASAASAPALKSMPTAASGVGAGGAAGAGSDGGAVGSLCTPKQGLMPMTLGDPSTPPATGNSLWSRSCCGPKSPPVVGKV